MSSEIKIYFTVLDFESEYSHTSLPQVDRKACLDHIWDAQISQGEYHTPEYSAQPQEDPRKYY